MHHPHHSFTPIPISPHGLAGRAVVGLGVAAAVEEDGGAGADVVGRGGVVVDAGFVLRQRDVARGAAAVGDGYDAHGGFVWGEGGEVGGR